MATVDDGRSPLCQSPTAVRHRAVAANGSQSCTTACPHVEADAPLLHTEPPPRATSPAAAARRATVAHCFARYHRLPDAAGQFPEPRRRLGFSTLGLGGEKEKSRERENG
jgi:hypothetical protein